MREEDPEHNTSGHLSHLHPYMFRILQELSQQVFLDHQLSHCFHQLLLVNTCEGPELEWRRN